MRSEFPFKRNFLDYLKTVRNYSAHTQSSYQTDLIQFYEFMWQYAGHNDVEKVDDLVARAWVRHLSSQDLSARTIHRKLSSLRAYLKFLSQQKLIERPIAIKIQLPKLSKVVPSYLKEGDMAKLLGYMEDQAKDFEGYLKYAIIQTFYHTGLRRAELIRLSWKDVDLSKGELKVLGKGNKERIVPFTQELKDILRLWLGFRRNEGVESELVFCSQSGEPLAERWVYSMVNDALSLTFSEKRSPHVLRHTFATHLLQNGADINAIKELLGHSSLNATQLYAHTDIKQLKKVYRDAHPFS